MKNNILKKFIVLFSLGFVLFGFNFVFAQEILPTIEITEATEVTVPVLSSISITTPASKLNYFVGEILDITGLEVTGVYSDGELESTKTELVTIANISGFDSSLPIIDQILTITFSEKTTTYKINIEDIVLKENFIIKNGDHEIWKGEVVLPDDSDVLINDKIVNSRSVLGMLYKIDEGSDNFSISNLVYDEYFNSFLLNCITISGSQPDCYNWQYAVNGSYPSIGMDKNILKGNESIYIFFGQTNKILVDSSSISEEENIIVTAQEYNYENNTWINNAEVEVSVVKTNPEDIYNPIEIQTGITDENGQKVFSVIPVGSYNAGLKVNDGGYIYYWPQEKFEVIATTVDNSGGGSSTPVPEKVFSISKALEFLTLNQKSDGSFGAPMYTDWVAIALGAEDSSNSNLVNYFKSNQINTGVITDYERRAMALMALGINPYDGTSVDYIKKIVDSFDGTQFGDDTLINDDIFALIVLKNAGYSTSDEIIKKDIEYIISKQSGSGSWDSIDMTAAGIQALSDLSGAGVSESITKAENYLISNQKNDGGFDNTSSTSWALQVLTNENNISKAKKYLDLKQQSDGGVEDITSDIETRMWATAYSIPAILHKSWDEILNDFSKPKVKEDSTSVPDVSKEEAKEEIIAPLVKVIQEEKEESLKLLADVQKINKTITKKIEIKKTQEEKPEIKEINQEIKESNPLMASAIVAEGDNNKFFSIISSFIDKIKAPFMWLLVKLGF